MKVNLCPDPNQFNHTANSTSIICSIYHGNNAKDTCMLFFLGQSRDKFVVKVRVVGMSGARINFEHFIYKLPDQVVCLYSVISYHFIIFELVFTGISSFQNANNTNYAHDIQKVAYFRQFLKHQHSNCTF
jgi:hypothetical protein